MRAVVLVGGFGTRLRPLTYSVPKPMLPVGHRPIIEHLVRRLGAAGVDEVVLALGFKPEPFLAAFPDGECAGIPLRYAVEAQPLDTAGAIAFAAREAGIDETFVVLNGDVICDLDLTALVAFHLDRGAEATLHLTPVPDPSAFGVVELAADGAVRRFVEKPAPGTAPSNLINAGAYVLEPSVVERVPPGRKYSIERDVFPAIVADGGIYGLATEDYWIDTGRPDTYLQANLDLLDGSRSITIEDAVQPGAVIDPTATVERSLVAAGARVGPNAKVVDSVLLPGARIGARAVVEGSVVMGGVGERATASRAVIGAEGVLEAGSALVDGRLPDPDGQ
jgi:mannose-1-phosphate guanylyltransferase